MLKLGFTGSQYGPRTEHQLEAVRGFIHGARIGHDEAEFHAGCCIGWDDAAAEMAREYGYRLIGHPPTKKTKIGKVEYDFYFPPLPYLERDHRIVDDTELLLAAPWTPYEQLRSGTWATIRFAVRRDKPGTAFYPDGTPHDLNRIVYTKGA